MRTLVSALLCFGLVAAFAREPQGAPGAPKDKPFAVQGDHAKTFDELIAPYVEQAGASYPEAKRRFQAGLAASCMLNGYGVWVMSITNTAVLAFEHEFN